MKTLRAVAVILLVLGFLASGAQAQVSSSRIEGLVQDPSGAVIPGAKVTLKNEATGVIYETSTTSAGTYSIPALLPGSYSVTITAEGFQTFTSTKNILTVGAPLVVNASLQVGAMAEVVEVEGSYEKIETTHAMVSDVVNRRAILELPLNGRNPLSLITLQPGLVQRTGGAAGSGTHVFGSRDRAHNVTIDGIDANESSGPNPQNNVYRLNPDAIQEYRVVTHNATPEFGRASGANVAIATRSGTNELHGNVYWFHRNTALNANEFFARGAGEEKPVVLLHQFGAEGGGPIIKNRTFFFASWQGNQIKQTQPIAASFGIPRVFTGAMRSGQFRFFIPDPANPLVIDGVTVTRNSPLLVDANGNLKPGIPLCTAPGQRRCVASYNIPASDPLGVAGGIDPAIAALNAILPLPNTFTVGDGLNFAGFSWNPPSGFTGPHLLFRVDHKFDDNNNIFGRILWSDWNTNKGDLLNSRPALYPGFDPLGEVSRRSHSAAISYRRVFSPRLVNEFTTGYSQFRFTFSLMEANTKSGQVPLPYAQECFGTDSFSLIDTPFCNPPHTQRAVTTIQFIDNLGYTRGAHSIRTGFNIRFYRHNDERGVPGGFNMSPTIIFSRTLRSPLSEPTTPVNLRWTVPATATGINTTDRNNLQQAIVELAGIVARVQQAFQADLVNDQYVAALFTLGTRIKQFNFYVQDEWKFHPKATMTYGLRWEVNLPPGDSAGRTFVPHIAVDGRLGPVVYIPAKKWFQRNNLAAFAPRVGLAITPFGPKMVIRAGYGIAFDAISTFQVTSIGGKVPGNTLLCQVNVQAAPGVCGDIPNNLRLSALLADPNFNPNTNPALPTLDPRLFPFTLGFPSAAPSTQFGPPNRNFLTAPNVGAFDPNLKVPTVHEWSLTIQRELPWGFVGQVGYIGKRGLRLYRAYDLNQIVADRPEFIADFLIARANVGIGCDPDGTVAGASTTACAGGTPPTLLLALGGATLVNGLSGDFRENDIGEIARRIDTAGFSTAVRPANYFRPNPQFSEIFYFDSGGSSHYHGFILQARRRFEKGLEFGFAYTFSKSIDDMSVDPVGFASGGALSATNSRTPTDVRNFRLDRTVSDFDNSHVVTSHFVYELPVGRGKTWLGGVSSWVEHLVGGWTLGGILTVQSGEPFTINSGVRTQNGFKVSRANLVGPVPDTRLKNGPAGPTLFIVDDINAALPNCRQVIGTTSFFCIPEPGQHGMSRNAFRGPGFWNFDFNIIKKVTFKERFNLQFRLEFFNLLNHVNFENPRNASVGSPTLTSSVFGQTCCITSSLPSSSTIIAVGEPNRVIQVALKLSF